MAGIWDSVQDDVKATGCTKVKPYTGKNPMRMFARKACKIILEEVETRRI